MSVNSFWKFVTGILLKPQAADPSTPSEGSLWYNSTEDRLKGYAESAVREFVTTDQAQTLENKTLEAAILNDAVLNDPTINDPIILDPVITVLDTNLTIQDNTTPSKQFKFEASGITAATTRTLTIPNANTTLVGTDATQTLSNKNLVDASTAIVSSVEPTSKIQFGANGIAGTTTNILVTGLTTQLISLPLGTTITLLGDTSTQTLTNKTIDGDLNTITDLPTTALKTVLADANKAIQRDLAGNVVSGATIPSTGSILVDTTAAQVLTSKTIDGDLNTLSDIGISSLKTVLADANKAVQRDAAGVVVSGASIPSTSSVLVDTTTSQPLSSKAISASTIVTSTLTNTNSIDVLDANFNIQDSSNTTRRITFNAGGTNSTTTTITAAQTSNRIITLPDATTTLVGTDTADTLTNKNLSDATTAFTDSFDPTIKLFLDAGGTTGTYTLLSANQTTDRSILLPDANTTLVGTNTTDTLTNKTLSGNTATDLINGAGILAINSTGTITLPNATDTLVGKATTDTLTNKTLTSPIVNAGTLNTPTTDIVTFDDQATPANPAAGFFKLYFKSDGELYKLNSAGVETVFSTGSAGANTQLSNLGITAINANLLPDATANNRMIGGTTNTWNTMYSQTVTFQDTSNTEVGRVARSATTPSGQSSLGMATTDATTQVSVFSANNGTVNATATARLLLETGNKTAGTGNSGNINIQTGTSSGGNRGVINLSGSEINITGDILPSADATYILGSLTQAFDTIHSTAMTVVNSTTNTGTNIVVAGTTNRTVTLPDATTTLAGLAVAQTFSAAQTFSSTITTPLTASRALTTGASSELAISATTATELGYVNGVTSSIQTQINTKAPTASPTFTGVVQIADGSVSAPSLAFSSDGANTGIYRVGADSLGFAANGVSVANYSSGGNFTFGVNGSSTSHTFYGNDWQAISASGSNNNFYIRTGNATAFSVLNFGNSSTAGDGMIVYNNNTKLLSFRTNATATDKGSMDTNGSWTLGPSGYTGDHAVKGSMTVTNAAGGSSFVTNTTSQPAMTLSNTHATSPSDGATLLNLFKGSTTNTTSQLFIKFHVNSGTGSGQINANGAGVAAFGSFSDRRLKENIVDLPSQLDNIMSLRPVEFDYKDGSGHQIGFIAQEIQEVYGDAVGIGENEMLTVTGWSKTESRLVKALQELKQQLDEVRAEFAAYKATHP